MNTTGMTNLIYYRKTIDNDFQIFFLYYLGDKIEKN